MKRPPDIGITGFEAIDAALFLHAGAFANRGIGGAAINVGTGGFMGGSGSFGGGPFGGQAVPIRIQNELGLANGVDTLGLARVPADDLGVAQ